MGTQNPNQTLLQGAHQSVSDQTPAPLTPNNSQVTFAFRGVQPPSTLYVDVDDQLILSAATSQTAPAEVVTVNVRLLLPNGRIEDMQFVIRPTSRSAIRSSFALAQGYILSISAVAGTAITRGATFLRIYIQRNGLPAVSPAQMLFADYVTTLATAAYPNGRVLSSLEGPGLLYGVSQSNPAAGADFIVSVPVNAHWKVRSLAATLTTSATVANRQPSINVSDLTGVKFRGFPLQNIAASTVALISAYPATPYTSVVATDFTLPLPPDLYMTGAPATSDNINSVTVGIQAADQWSAIRLLVEEWLDNV
jgi:hypothetical protein